MNADDDVVPPEPSTDGAGDRHRSWFAKLVGHRSKNRYLAGVAGGLGEQLGVDPFFVRTAFAVGTVALADGASAILPGLYLVLWLVVPTADERSILRRLFTVPAAQEALAAVLLFSFVLIVLSVRGLIGALALLGLAWALLTNWVHLGSSAMSSQPVVPNQAKSSTTQIQPVAAEASESSAGLSDQAAKRWARTWRRASPDAPPPKPSSEPSLFPIALGLLVALAVVSIALDNMLDPGVDPAVVADIGLGIVGMVVMIGAWKGRVAGSVLLAVPLLVIWVAFSVSGVGRFADGPGIVRPTSVPDNGELSYEQGFGDLVVDLRSLELEPGSRTIVHTGVTAGATTVRVPTDTKLELRSHVGIGSVSPIYVRVRGEPQHRPQYWAWPEPESSPSGPLVNGRWSVSLRSVQNRCFEFHHEWSQVAPIYAGYVDLNQLERPPDFHDPASAEKALQAISDNLAAIEQAGYYPPVPMTEYQFDSESALVIFDDNLIDQPWQIPFVAWVDSNGLPCVTDPYESDPRRAAAKPVEPATIIVETTTGIGTVEVIRG